MAQEGKINITVQMDPKLLSIVEHLAQREGKGKSPYIEDLIKAHVLQKHGPELWQALYEKLLAESS